MRIRWRSQFFGRSPANWHGSTIACMPSFHQHSIYFCENKQLIQIYIRVWTLAARENVFSNTGLSATTLQDIEKTDFSEALKRSLSVVIIDRRICITLLISNLPMSGPCEVGTSVRFSRPAFDFNLGCKRVQSTELVLVIFRNRESECARDRQQIDSIIDILVWPATKFELHKRII